MEFKQVWDNIKRHENEEFVTKRGLVLTYELFGDSIKPSRTDYFISKSDFKKAMKLMPLKNIKEISSICRGPSYIYAIMMDKRICG